MFNKPQGDTNMVNSILRLPDVISRTGLSRSTIYQQISEGTFPEPVSLGMRAVGWLEPDIDRWLQNKAEMGWVSRKPVKGEES